MMQPRMELREPDSPPHPLPRRGECGQLRHSRSPRHRRRRSQPEEDSLEVIVDNMACLRPLVGAGSIGRIPSLTGLESAATLNIAGPWTVSGRQEVFRRA